MRNIGIGEIVLILLIVLLIFGANRLPQLGEGLGKAIRGLKRGLSTNDDIDVSPAPGGAKPQISEKSSAEPAPKPEKVAAAEVVEKKRG